MGIPDALFELDQWVASFDDGSATGDEFVYVVQRGDNLSVLAKRFGLSGWWVIYNHPSNAAFRRLRPHPNRIFVGDKVFIPTDDLGLAECNAGCHAKFNDPTTGTFVMRWKALRRCLRECRGTPV